MKCAWELRVLLVHPSDVQAAQQAFSPHISRGYTVSAKLATSYLTSQEVTLLSKKLATS